MVFQWNVRWFGTSVVIWNPLEKDLTKRKQVRLKKFRPSARAFIFHRTSDPWHQTIW